MPYSRCMYVRLSCSYLACISRLSQRLVSSGLYSSLSTENWIYSWNSSWRYRWGIVKSPPGLSINIAGILSVPLALVLIQIELEAWWLPVHPRWCFPLENTVPMHTRTDVASSRVNTDWYCLIRMLTFSSADGCSRPPSFSGAIPVLSFLRTFLYLQKNRLRHPLPL